jgi:hypothetical protein
MATHFLSTHFASFFGSLNPGSSFETTAASQYNSIKELLENTRGPAAILSPSCFLQGSYRQQTAIYSINDVDIIALCQLWQPGAAAGGRSFGRDDIFQIIASALHADGRYRGKVNYGPGSMCIKVDLGIQVEILPVVFKAGNNEPQSEPFRLYRPERAVWEDGYARYHQQWLTWKNRNDKTGGNFIPAVKVVKHLRSRYGLDAVSFHIECLLFSIPDALFQGSAADYIPAILEYVASQSAATHFQNGCNTPCGERNIFSDSEWQFQKWQTFHNHVITWSRAASAARGSANKSDAIRVWQALLGDDHFPAQVS